MLKIGLTGGIATGKSLVREELRRLGAATLDSDWLARQSVEPGQPALAEIVESFGPDILTSEGSLDRKKLASKVFQEADARERLNRILHPPILRRQEEWLKELSERRRRPPFAVVDAALMIETGSYRRYDAVIVVHCRPEQQIQRLMRRDSISRDEARARIQSQMPIEEKLRFADYAIDNSGSIEGTLQQVRTLFERIAGRAADTNKNGHP